MRKACTFVLVLGASWPSVMAQAPEVRRAVPVNPAPTSTPQVRRAEPVNAPNYENPEWMYRVQGEPTPVPSPVPTAVPQSQQRPVRSGEATTPQATPVPEGSAPQVPATPPADENGSIRLRPTQATPQNQALLAGNGFFRRELYEMAIHEYERFLIAEPQSPDRAGALFRLAESHRFLGNDNAARSGYERLIEQVRTGEFVGSAAYRLGEIAYAEGRFGTAASMFETARKNSSENAVKLSAEYYQASALMRLGRERESLALLEALAAKPGNNPYRDTADFAIAEAKSRTGRKADALAIYEKLGDRAEKAEMQAEATVKAAALAAELRRDELARTLFDKALSKPAIGEWRGVAVLGALRLAYTAGDYSKASEMTEKEIGELPKESRAEALFIVANAHRQLGKTEEATELYEDVIAKYPKSVEASQARFQRLMTTKNPEGENLHKDIDAFLEVSTDPAERSRAYLLKAELLFKEGDYAKAAEFYSKSLGSTMPERLAEQALYKLGWSELQSGQATAAQQTFGKFLDTYKDSALVPSALAQRALAHQQAKAYDQAMRDFTRLIEDYPKAPERELALQQKALVLGQQEKYDEMISAFQQLLKDYPESKAAAQAEYWIGWAAFEKKDYATAIEHLKRAREVAPEEFGQQSSVRIILAHYYQEDRAAVAEEAEKAGPGVVPSEVVGWLGRMAFDEGNFTQAEEFLGPMVAENAPVPPTPDLLIAVAQARIAQQKYDEARSPVDRYLSQARDPISRARGLLALSEILMNKEGDLDTAQRLIEEALLLQPEGRYNAEGRILAGELQMKRGRHDEAARTFLTVAVLTDDPKVTPRALKKAAAAYKKAGNSEEANKALKELEQRFPDQATQTTAAAE